MQVIFVLGGAIKPLTDRLDANWSVWPENQVRRSRLLQALHSSTMEIKLVE